ncbi:Lrp/AsnC family transcriptional regulator [Nocardioides carbamazepini]|uniref:Lrp/AsnC family transcriptional regulator n=1 Tax=Nocardioides carbamazepini TaxID=2854259 RepID=UPI00214A5D07|nr:Lrp/AsnC family transcriptional regulator [Nocardioides carbamazepini]MCR1783374.1 Lrp/AsnC family transcriptional regulator [Nocardioides carbamazepini]
MDELDARIVEILVADGRASFSRIGGEIGLSTNATAARIRRLEAQGVIVGYRAILAQETPEPDAGIEGFIDVRLPPESDSAEFLAWAGRHRAVADAVHVTGPYDYLLHIRVRDMRALDQLLRELKTTGRASQTQTRIALR